MTSPIAGHTPLQLGSTTLRDATALQAELAERLDDSGTVHIDARAVQRIDTAALQLLAAFVRDLRADGRAVEWTECSAALRRAADSLGLADALDLTVDQT